MADKTPSSATVCEVQLAKDKLEENVFTKLFKEGEKGMKSYEESKAEMVRNHNLKELMFDFERILHTKISFDDGQPKETFNEKYTKFKTLVNAIIERTEKLMKFSIQVLSEHSSATKETAKIQLGIEIFSKHSLKNYNVYANRLRKLCKLRNENRKNYITSLNSLAARDMQEEKTLKEESSVQFDKCIAEAWSIMDDEAFGRFEKCVTKLMNDFEDD